jgi:peptidoglycan/LPS O-acetylase OafA/YrhL
VARLPALGLPRRAAPREIPLAAAATPALAPAPAQAATPAPAPAATHAATPAPAPAATHAATPAPAPAATHAATPALASVATQAATPAAVLPRTRSAPAAPAPSQPATTRPATPILGNVQALRAIAVLMVVSVHVGNPHGFEPRYLGGSSLMGWANLPGQVGVDLFFVISGLIMAVTTWHARDGAASARHFLARRLKRIFPIYWVVTILVLAVYLTRPELVNSHSSHEPQILQSFLLAPQAGLPLLAVGWTLTFELYFYALFALGLLAGRRRLPWILGAWGVLTLGLALVFEGSAVPVLHLVGSPLCIEFVLGAGVGWLVMSRPPVAPRTTLLAGVAWMTAAVAFASTAAGTTTFDPWFRLVAIAPAAALVVLGAVGIERSGRLVAPRRLQYLGDASYSIYLWHTLLLVAAGKLITMLVPHPGSVHVLLLVAVPIGVLAATVALYELVERPLLRAVNRRRRAASRAREAAA